MALLARAQALEAAGLDVIHLEVGEPDFPCPAPVMEAGRAALQRGQTRYSPAVGIPALREEIASWYRRCHDVEVAPERVIVTPGASGALQLALAALVDPGDGVLMADPGYPCNRHFLELVNGEAQPVPLGEADGFAVTAHAIASHWRTNTVAALLASPDNPTGSVLDLETMAGIARVVHHRGGALLVDEIYQGLVYGVPSHSILEVAPEALVVNSFSKYFGMTGWRLGWLVAPEALVPALERMAQNFFLAPSTLAQHAALAAFQPETLRMLERRRDELARRRDFLLARLPELGIRVVGQPRGAFYLYLDISGLTDDSFGFCEQLLESEQVALTPGLDFGPIHEPRRFVRLAYTTGVERLAEALTRIQRFLGR